MDTASTPLSAETIALLRRAATPSITSQLVKRGLRRTVMVDVKPLRPHDRLVGVAFTLRYVPAREDRDVGVVYNNETNIQRLAIERVGPGEVLVIDARGEIAAGTLGNILAARLRTRGAAGIVTDGAFRDAARIAEEPFPTYCRAANAQLSSVCHYPADLQVVIGCGGVLVAPGDVLVGDEDGVVVIPRPLADEVARDAAAQEELEEYLLERVHAGASIKAVYPPDEATLAGYQAWRAERGHLA